MNCPPFHPCAKCSPFSPFLHMQFVFVNFSTKGNQQKATLNMLVKLTPGILNLRIFPLFRTNWIMKFRYQRETCFFFVFFTFFHSFFFLDDGSMTEIFYSNFRLPKHSIDIAKVFGLKLRNCK